MDRTTQPEVQTLKNSRILPPVRMTLPNGILLAIINAGEQEVVHIDVLFTGGRWQQSQKPRVLLTSRMLCEGTKKYTVATIAEKLDYYGLWLELSSSSKYAYITVYPPNKYLAKTLEVVESMVKESLFPEKELHTIPDTNTQQYQASTSKVDSLAYRSPLRPFYGKQHPCGRIVVEEDYHAIIPEVFCEFYERYYYSGGCSIFLSGKVTEDIISRVIDTFGTSLGQHQQQVSRLGSPSIAIPGKRIFTEREDVMQGAVKMGYTTIIRNHPDYLRLRILMTLFGGYFGSWLMPNIREEKGYTYGVSAGIMFYPDSGLLVISIETDNEYMEPLVQEAYHEIDRPYREPASAEESTIVRNYMLGEICRSCESPFSLSDAWIFIATSGLNDDYFSCSLLAVNEATLMEMQDLAQHYLCKETLKEAIAGKKLS